MNNFNRIFTKSQAGKEKKFFALPNSNFFQLAKSLFLSAITTPARARDFGAGKKYGFHGRGVRVPWEKLAPRERALLAKAFVFICARATEAGRAGVFFAKSKDFQKLAQAKGGARPAGALELAARFLADFKCSPEGETARESPFASVEKIWGGVKITLNTKPAWKNKKLKTPAALFFANKTFLPTALFTLNANAFKGSLAIIRQARLGQNFLGMPDFLRDSGMEQNAARRNHEGRVRVRAVRALQAIAAVLDGAGLQVEIPNEKGRAFLKSRVGLVARPALVEHTASVGNVGKPQLVENPPTLPHAVRLKGKEKWRGISVFYLGDKYG